MRVTLHSEVGALLLLAVAVGCSSPTSLRVDVDAAPSVHLKSLDATASLPGAHLATLLDVGGAPPRLPVALTVLLPDVAADVTITFDAVDLAGAHTMTTATVHSTPHQQIPFSITIPGQPSGSDLDGGASDGELTVPDDLAGDASANDLSPADLAQAVTTPITQGAAASGTAETQTTLSIPAPAGANSGDVLVATIYLGDSANTAQPTITPSVAWNLVERVDHGTVGALLVYWRVTTATEPSNYSFTSSAAVSGVGWVLSYRGVNRTAPVDTHAGASFANQSACSTPAITTSVANTMTAASFAGYYSNGTPSSWIAPTEMTQIANLNNNNTRSGVGAVRFQAAPGVAPTATATASVAQEYCITHMMALKPN